MKKKILFAITKSVWGGAGKYVYDLAVNLPTDRFDVAVVAGPACRQAGGTGILFEKLREAGIRTISVPELARDIRIGKELRSFRALLRLFKQEQPDIIHLNSSKVGGLGALAARIEAFRLHKKIRVMFTVHGWGFLEDRPLWWRIPVFLASWASTLFQDTVILINKRDYVAAQKFIPRRKLALIPNGYVPRTSIPAGQARRFFSERLGKQISPDTVVIGTIAELTKNKGLKYLIDAINQIKFKTIIIGEGEERAHLEQQIHDLHLENTVLLLGFIPDAAQYLSGMDIFVLPSVKEGLPYAIIEAVAAQVPVIASNIGGIPDLISHNENGILIPPKNIVALAEAIEHLAKNKEERIALGKRGAHTIKTKFSLRAMLEKTQHLYETAD